MMRYIWITVIAVACSTAMAQNSFYRAADGTWKPLKAATAGQIQSAIDLLQAFNASGAWMPSSRSAAFGGTFAPAMKTPSPRGGAGASSAAAYAPPVMIVNVLAHGHGCTM